MFYKRQEGDKNRQLTHLEEPRKTGGGKREKGVGGTGGGGGGGGSA